MSKGIVFRNHQNEKIYPCPYMPIGSIYISVNSTNPSTYFGGAWEQIKDKFLLACGSSYANGTTGGEANHTLTVDEIPSHTHPIYSGYGDIGSPTMTSDAYRYQYWGGNSRGWKTGTLGAGATGGGRSHNNMPPYIAVYVWKRTK